MITLAHELIRAVNETIQLAREEGVFGGIARERLEETIETFGRGRLDQCLEAAERLRNETDPAALMGDLGRDYGDLMEASATFITHMRQFLSASRQRVVSEIDQLEGAGEFIAAQE